MTASAALYDRIDRLVKTATTYARKAEAALDWAAYAKVSIPVSPSYPTLLDALLDAAAAIVKRGIPDDYFDKTDGYNLSDDMLERARKVVAAIEDRRVEASDEARIRALENVQGRTPEEAAAYLAKAAEMRQRRTA